MNLKMLCGVKEVRTEKCGCPLISEGGLGPRKFVDFQGPTVGPPSY